MSRDQVADQYSQLIQMGELNEGEAIKMILKVSAIPFQDYVYEHDTVAGRPLLDRYTEWYADVKAYVAEQQKEEKKDES